jgi:transcription termination factor Rho
MAFKATRKPSATKKTKATDDETMKKTPKVSVEEPVVTAPAEPPVAFSIDDFVGAPKGQEEPVVVGEPKGESDPVPQPRPSYVGTERGNYSAGQGDRGRRDFSSGHGGNRGRGRFEPRHRGGYGYDRGGYGGNRDFHRGGGQGFNRDNGYRRDDGYRRDFGDAQNGSSGAAFTPDVDVPTETVRGVLDTMPDGHGFLRPKYTPSERDVYISQSQIRRFLLRNGDMVEGQARPPKDNERYWGLLKVEKVNELLAEQMEKRPRFEDLVPVYPNKQLRLETEDKPLSTRIIDLLAPIGFGQRGLVVSPPKAGKTTVLKELASGISKNYPEVHLMAVLIGERPEEVTDITRSVHGEVYASNFDESPEHQTRVAEVALDRAKRLIEMGHDVVILLDSITRLARAYNLVVNPSGRTLTGGFDPAALYPAKKFLGAARCNEPFLTPEEQAGAATGEKPVVKRVTDGGSLTIIGTALVETGSRMDDLIYEEFKGTGNMELHLSRSLQERRIFPAIDVGKSGTRHDELLLGEENMKRVTTLRHMLSLLSDEERTQMLIDRLGKTKNNAEFIESLSQG